MQTRRDLVQAYGFATGRLASALVSGNPGSGEIPMRRSGLGSMFGVVVAVLLAAGFAVFGLIDPGGNTAWKQPGSLIVEKETGSRYIYSGGVLHPVANYSSALLALNGKAVVRDVSGNSLAGVPDGTAVGIPGAPDSIPTPQQLVAGSWTYCVHPDHPGDQVIDFSPGDHTTAVPDQHWVMVSGPDGSVYLLWDNMKYPLISRADIIALGMDALEPIPAPSAWLDALPTGAPLTAASIPNLGSPGPDVAGQPTRVGWLFHTVMDGHDHYYVVLSGGLAPVSPTESALLAAGTSPSPVTVSPSDIAVAPAAQDQALLNGVPDILGGTRLHTGGAQLNTGAQALCLLQHMNGTRVQSTLVQENGPASTAGSRVLVSPGHGLLASLPATNSFDTPQIYLITDLGEKFPLSNSNAVQDLGYSGAPTRVLPATVLDQIPTGPVLSTSGASAPINAAANGVQQ